MSVQYVNERLELPPLPLDEATRSLFSFTNKARFESMSDEELAQHIALARNEAQTISRWECGELYMFLPPQVRACPPPGHYQRIIERLRSQPTAMFLEVGAMFGIACRVLVQDGVRPEQIVCTDLLPEYFQVGLRMFDDKPTDAHLQGMKMQKFNIFDEQDVQSLRDAHPNGFDVIYADMFIHLFPLQDQTKALRTLDKLLSKTKGSTLFGMNAGTEDGQEFTKQMGKVMQWGSTGITGHQEDFSPVFVHSPSSLVALCAQTFTQHPVDVEIEVRQKQKPRTDNKPENFTYGFDQPKLQFLHFAVVRM